MYIYLIVMRRAIELKQWIFVAKSKGHKQNTFQTDDMEIRYNCAVLYINCAKGIIFGNLVTVIFTLLPSSFFNNSVNQWKLGLSFGMMKGKGVIFLMQ